MSKDMRFLIVGDLHGQIPNIYVKDFDAIIAPGDFCSDETKSFQFEALRERLKNPKSKVSWWSLAGEKKAKQYLNLSLKNGRKVLEHLNSFGKPVYIVPGNWDWTGDPGPAWLKKNHYPSLYRGLENIIDVYHARKSFSGYSLIGHGITAGPEYPQYARDKKGFTKKELAKKRMQYEKLYAKVGGLFKSAQQPIIYLSHNVPFNTPLDKINNPLSPRDGDHFGSLVSRKIIEKYQPIVCIGGHMHEHFDRCNIGKTVCINTGFGSNVNVLLELNGSRVRTTFYRNGKKVKK
jgi:Icc-related predicted phosphoesterase